MESKIKNKKRRRIFKVIDNKTTIKDDEKANIRRGVIRHEPTWIGLTYKYAVKKRGVEEVEATMRRAISETGRVQGSGIRECYEKPESCENFFNTMFTPTLQESSEAEVKEKNGDVLDVELHHCPLLKAWQDPSFDDALCAELCDVAMDGNRDIARAMGFDFHLGDIIVDGCPTCQVRLSREE